MAEMPAKRKNLLLKKSDTNWWLAVTLLVLSIAGGIWYLRHASAARGIEEDGYIYASDNGNYRTSPKYCKTFKPKNKFVACHSSGTGSLRGSGDGYWHATPASNHYAWYGPYQDPRANYGTATYTTCFKMRGPSNGGTVYIDALRWNSTFTSSKVMSSRTVTVSKSSYDNYCLSNFISNSGYLWEFRVRLNSGTYVDISQVSIHYKI